MSKEIIIIAGGNGVGKTTFARELLREYDYEFLNVDEIAKSLSFENPAEKKISAGKLFFEKLNESVAADKSILIESTLSGRYLQKFIENLSDGDYKITIIFLFAESSEILIERIAERVKKGGHFIPAEDVQRRFKRGKNNFWQIYKHLADRWHLYYNMENRFQFVAVGEKNDLVFIEDELFEKFSRI